MLLAGAGYGPASNKWMRPVAQLFFAQVGIAACWLSIPPLPPCGVALWFNVWRDLQCCHRSVPPLGRRRTASKGVSWSFSCWKPFLVQELIPKAARSGAEARFEIGS